MFKNCQLLQNVLAGTYLNIHFSELEAQVTKLPGQLITHLGRRSAIFDLALNNTALQETQWRSTKASA